MSTNTNTSKESTDVNRPPDIDERDERALTGYLTVLERVGRAANAPGRFLVISGSHGDEYLVDVERGTCECSDFEHRRPVGGCKHLRRVQFEIGKRPVPAEYIDLLPMDFAKHVDAEPRYVATDGGSPRPRHPPDYRVAEISMLRPRACPSEKMRVHTHPVSTLELKRTRNAMETPQRPRGLPGGR